MSFNPTQRDFDILFQTTKQIYSKVELLNSNFGIFGSIEGKLIGDSYNVDATSNVRRTYNCTIQVTTPVVEFDKNNEFWFDKYVRPYVGIYDNVTDSIVWYLKGTYSPLNAVHNYDDSTNTLSMTFNDLMCRLTGDLDGQFRNEALSNKIEAGTDIKEAIESILKYFGFTQTNICEIPRRISHDLEFSAGTAAYQMISSIMEFAPNYEFFFDLNGVFTIQRLPCYKNDPDIFGNDVMQKLLVRQDSYSVGFKAKNCVEVWGKSYDENSVDRMAESCESSDGMSYSVLIRNGKNSDDEELTWDAIPDYLVFAVTMPTISNKAGCEMIINVAGDSFGPYKIYDDYDRELKADLLTPDTTLIFYFDVDTETIAAKNLNLRGCWSETFEYAKNDVVIEKNAIVNDDKYHFFIAQPPDGEDTVPIETYVVDTNYWKEIVFTSAFECVGEYNDDITYNSTEMVVFGNKLYYCLKNGTKGTLPGTDIRKWDTVNMNINGMKLGNRLRFLGNMTAHGIYKNESDSKFSISEMGREYWEVCSGGEYDNIRSDMLAKERAMYECYYKANLNEVLSLTLVDIPWLDVNKKVSYKRALGTEVERWMINSISSETLSGTCSISLSKFYPDWSEIFRQEYI